MGPASIEELLHGTTVASNAILEMTGARTGLITTRGFRDVLELRTLRMPRLYDIGWEKPPPLVPRYLRLTVDERVDARGGVERAPSREEIETVVDRLVGEQVESIAVCLINSFANPAHERLIGEVIAERAPGLPHCLSVDVLLEVKEYERTSTTVVNAYLLPVVAGYLESLVAELEAGEIRSPLLLMQSNGGLTTADRAVALPCHIIESGPAGGVVGSHALAVKLGLGDVVTFDMGGTTAKASLVEGGEYSRAVDFRRRSGGHCGLASAHRRRLPAQGARDRSRGGRRRWRLDRVDRRGRRDADRAPERRRHSRTGVLRARGPGAHRDRRERRARLPQSGLPGRRRGADRRLARTRCNGEQGGRAARA